MPVEAPEQRNRYEQDRTLLRQYVENGSQAAFSQLVKAHQSFVYSVCLREVRNSDMAKDVAQTVFLVLAQKAKRIRRGTALTAWLFQTARLTSREFLRKERTRMLHEQEAMEQRLIEENRASQQWEQDIWRRIDLHLNEALSVLKPGERDAVLLRYFEEMSLKEVGAALNLSEDSARMRIHRALEKMRKALERLGIVIATASLASVLSRHAAQASVPVPNLDFLIDKTSANTPQALLARKVIGKMNFTLFKTALVGTFGVFLVLSGPLTLVKSAPAYRDGFGGSKASVSHTPAPPSEAEQDLIRSLTLPENFTLQADSITQATLTANDKQLYLNSHHSVLNDSLKAGKITQAQFAANLQAVDNLVADDNPDFHYRLHTVMSGRNGALLMDLTGKFSVALFPQGHEPYFYFVYDGAQTRYFLEPTLQTTPGLDFQSLHDNNHWLVMPGVGTSQAPLIKAIEPEDLVAYRQAPEGSVCKLRCDLYTVEEGESTSSYTRGVAVVKKAQGKPQVLSMTPDGLQEAGVPEWQFSNFALFHEVWIAKKIQRTTFMSTTFESKPGARGTEFTQRRMPLYRTETQITQISEKALALSKFDVAKNIPTDAERNTTTKF